MKKMLLYLLVLTLLLTSCAKKSRYTAKVARPKYHHSWFNHREKRPWYVFWKSKKAKRTKVVKMQS